MWPAVPNVMPTILLFSVAIAVLVFDGCSESPPRLHSQLLARDAGSILEGLPRRPHTPRSTADTALLAVLVGYMWPTTKFARWAVTIGGAAVYVVSSTKTVSFAISAVMSRTSFDFGNNSGTNSDL